MNFKATIISIVSVLVIGLTAILLYCFWPAIKGTVDNSKYYTQEELQKSYDKGYEDGCKSEAELTGQVNYYKGLVDEYYIQVNTLNNEITMLTNNNKDYQAQVSNLTTQKTNLQAQVENLTTIKTNNETTIASLNSQISNLQNQVTNLTNSVEDKNEQISQLNNQIVNLQNAVSQLQTTNDMNLNTITSLNTQIANLNNQISEMTLLSQTANTQIASLNNKINELQKSITYYESYIAQLENGEQVVATFEFDGSVYNIQIVNKGSKLSVTTPASTDYKIFNGWKINGSIVDLSTYTINTNTKIVADITYKYDVKFKVDDTVYNNQIITKNGYANLPTTPTKTGYEFDGWSLNGVDVISDITTKQVTENTTYVAVFTKLHTVTFIYENETKSTQTIRNGKFATTVNIDNTDYKIFNGWKINDTIVDLSTYKIVADTTFIADITYKYDVIFKVDNTIYNSQIVAKNGYATLPTNPTKDGYEFSGWSLNGVDVLNNIETIQVSNNTTYIAIFVEMRAGLYETGSTNLVKSWDQLIADGDITIKNGVLQCVTKSLAGDLIIENIDGITSLASAFKNCKYLTSIDLSKLNSTQIKYVASAFENCYALTNIDFSNFNTSLVLSMLSMFQNCRNLTKLDLSNFNTSNVSDMSYMFSGCSSLNNLNISNFDTTKVTTMRNMFYNCSSLSELNLSSFNTSNVKYMDYMFDYCKSLTKLDLSNFNTSNVTDMISMFDGCHSLSELNISNFSTTKVTSMRNMFNSCRSLKTLNLDSFKTSSVNDFNSMFNGCSALESLKFANLDTSRINISGVSSCSQLENMFYLCNVKEITYSKTVSSWKKMSLYQFTSLSKSVVVHCSDADYVYNS